MRQMKKKKTRLWIVLTVVAIIVAALGILAYTQRNNIKAISYASKYSADEIAERSKQVDADIKTAVNSLPDVTLNPLTDEQRKQLGSGEISRDDAIKIIMGEDGGETVPDTETYTETDETETAAETEKSDTDTRTPEERKADINRLIAEIYLLKAEFLNRIDDLIAQGQEERYAIPKEKRTFTVKIEMAKKYASLGNKLVLECDGEMEALLSTLESELKAEKSDTSIVSQMRSLYEEEKALKKADLMACYWPR